MHKRLVALPSRQAAEHRRGGGREMVSISRVEGRTGCAARTPGVATSREVRAREPQPRTLKLGGIKKDGGAVGWVNPAGVNLDLECGRVQGSLHSAVVKYAAFDPGKNTRPHQNQNTSRCLRA